mmetsp:Transcript_6468/g.14640  ORF Transcript_6468/g.14640 Transcript_6468/m.14640 type:complete len:359 (+) Transcript_6468:328-1404(+)
MMRGNRGKADDSLLYPLLESEHEDDDDHSYSESEHTAYSKASTARSSEASVAVQQTKFQRIKTAAVYVGLAGGVGLSALACVASPVVMVFVMAGVCVANAPYAAFKEHRIVKLPALRSLNNKLRDDANRLEDEVDKLSEVIDRLEPEAERAKVVEEELREIASEQQVNVDKLVDLVKENEAILDQMQDNLRQRIVQDVMRIVVMCDTNNDGVFNKVETKMLVLKIRMTLQEYGVEFDEHKFMTLVMRNPRVTTMLGTVKKLLHTDEEDEERKSATTVDASEDAEDDASDDSDDDDIYDMFHIDTSNNDELAGSLARSTSASIDRRMSSHGGSGRISLALTNKQGSARMRRQSLASQGL